MEHSLFCCGCESKLISSWSKTLVPSYWKFQSILYTELFIAQASFVISPVIYLSFQVVLFPFFPLNFFVSFSPSLPLHPHLTSPVATSWREALKQILMSISKCRCSHEAFHSHLAWVILQLIFWSYLTQGVVPKHYSMKSLVMSRILTSFSCFRW